MESPANYYRHDLKKLYSNLSFAKKRKVWIDNQPNLRLINKYDFIFLSHSLSYLDDVQTFAQKLKKNCHQDTIIIIVYFNFIWKPLLQLATKLGFRNEEQRDPNWLSEDDIKNLFFLENYQFIRSGKRFLLPLNLGIISQVINQYFSQFPLINSLALTNYLIFRPPQKPQNYSVSIIIPARNESGNMKNILSKIPFLGKQTEIIFVEGHSKDNTYQAIQSEIKNYHGKLTPRLFKQKGVGKADAVRLGFDKAKGEILMILDADLTVDPSQLPKFYQAIAQGKGNFGTGSRLVYPMETQAMKFLNYLGNKFFSVSFSFLLEQKNKDRERRR